jgi:hypothetical protein
MLYHDMMGIVSSPGKRSKGCSLAFGVGLSMVAQLQSNRLDVTANRRFLIFMAVLWLKRL